MKNPPIVIGHRGAPGYRPEHTSSSYKTALNLQVDAVEPDLVLSKDGIFVIRHENEISGTTNVADIHGYSDRQTTKIIDGESLTGWFSEDFTWEELQQLRCVERIPKLRPQNTRFNYTEAILNIEQLCIILDEHQLTHQRDLTIVIELKHISYYEKLGYDYTKLFIKEFLRLNIHKRFNVVIESFELEPLLKLKECDIEATFIFLIEDQGAPQDQIHLYEHEAKTYEWFRSTNGLKYLSEKVDGVSLNKNNLFTQKTDSKEVTINDTVTNAQALGLTVYTWTLRPENFFLNNSFKMTNYPEQHGNWLREWELILSTGVDGVFVDHPDLIRDILPIPR